MDPACGCGNFLIIAYRELRRLELRLLRALREDDPSQVLDVALLLRVAVDQFAGIEIEPFPAEISRVSLWLIDHLCNREASLEFGQNYARIPIRDTPRILCANALATDWRSLAPDAPATNSFSYILGNPPFNGARTMSLEQKADVLAVFGDTAGVGNLDFVTAWYKKATDLIQGSATRCAFVSTNSISQGEQVATLWKPLMERNHVVIDFAYRTFKWRNEASGNAAVHCVIVGFSCKPGPSSSKNKVIYDETGAPHLVRNINAYLVDAPDVFVERRSKPICAVPEIGMGNQPIDDGNYLFTDEEMTAFLEMEPNARRFFKPWYGAIEFINRAPRHCLWLGDCPPNELRQMPECMKRVEAVRQFRMSSRRASTLKLAAAPTRFQTENMPKGDYIVIPEVSSERRRYVPIGFMTPEILCSNKLRLMPGATIYHFGVLTSSVHMAWMRAVCGRLEMRYRYSKDIVYNNFIWPTADDARKAAVTAAAQAVLDARAKYPESTLADLYDPLTMPPELSKAHTKLDALVDKLYGRAFATDADRVAHLFALYAAAAN